MPKVIIFAGANGSGKTTLANTIIKPGMSYINADAIKKRDNLSSLEAGKRALTAIDKNIARGTTFAFETTMSGALLLKRFRNLKNKGYTITIYYLFAYPIELLDERIKERVKKGGHPVEYADIERRYYRSAKKFWNIYRKYADTWGVLLNNEYRYKDIVVGNKDVFKVLDKIEFSKFKEVIHNV